MFLNSPYSTQPTKQVFLFQASAGMLQSRTGTLVQPRICRPTYCFWERPRIGLCSAWESLWQASFFMKFRLGAEGWAGCSPGVFLRLVGLAHYPTHSAQREFSAPPPLQLIFFVFDRVPGQENKNKAHKFEASRQTEVDETERRHVVLPARPLHSTFLLPEHTGGVNHSSKVNRSRNVCCSHGKKEKHRNIAHSIRENRFVLNKVCPMPRMFLFNWIFLKTFFHLIAVNCI